MKRHTPYNTLVGTIPGALPALGGYVAVGGTPGAGGWALFAILALWQMPHFLALAWMYRKDYARAGFAMLPVVSPEGYTTVRQALLFTIALVLASTVPTLLGDTGWVYLAGALILGIWFLAPTYAFYRSRNTQDARRVLAGINPLYTFIGTADFLWTDGCSSLFDSTPDFLQAEPTGKFAGMIP